MDHTNLSDLDMERNARGCVCTGLEEALCTNVHRRKYARVGMDWLKLEVGWVTNRSDHAPALAVEVTVRSLRICSCRRPSPILAALPLKSPPFPRSFYKLPAPSMRRRHLICSPINHRVNLLSWRFLRDKARRGDRRLPRSLAPDFLLQAHITDTTSRHPQARAPASKPRSHRAGRFSPLTAAASVSHLHSQPLPVQPLTRRDGLTPLPFCSPRGQSRAPVGPDDRPSGCCATGRDPGCAPRVGDRRRVRAGRVAPHRRPPTDRCQQRHQQK